MDYTNFIGDAQNVQAATGVPASIILGQLILESGRELSGLATKGKNLFGVKGTGSAGSIAMPTKEFKNGQMVATTGTFAAYDSYYDSLKDHARILQLPRYTQYTAGAKTIEDYAKGIKAGGYATDPNYSEKLVNIIHSYKLDQYDDKTKWTSSGAVFPQNVDKTIKPWTATGTTAAPDITSFSQGVVRVAILTMLVIFSVVFLLKAFPVTSNVVDGGKVVDLAKTVITKRKGA